MMEYADTVMGTSEELSMRRKNIGIIAGLALLGYILPTYVMSFMGPGSWQFTIGAPFQAGVPWQMRVILIQPLLIAILLPLAAFKLNARLRGAVILALWALPVIAIFSDADVRRSISWSVRFFASDASSWLALSLFIGINGLIAGIRSRIYRPASESARWVGIVGSAAFLIAFIIPVGPLDEGGMLILSLFQALKLGFKGGEVFLALTVVGAFGCWIASAVITIMNRVTDDLDAAHAKAKRANTLLLVGLGLLALGTMQLMTRMHAGFGPFISILKAIAWAAGVGFLLEMAITEFVIGDPPEVFDMDEDEDATEEERPQHLSWLPKANSGDG